MTSHKKLEEGVSQNKRRSRLRAIVSEKRERDPDIYSMAMILQAADELRSELLRDEARLPVINELTTMVARNAAELTRLSPEKSAQVDDIRPVVEEWRRYECAHRDNEEATTASIRLCRAQKNARPHHAK